MLSSTRKCITECVTQWAELPDCPSNLPRPSKLRNVGKLSSHPLMIKGSLINQTGCRRSLRECQRHYPLWAISRSFRIYLSELPLTCLRLLQRQENLLDTSDFLRLFSPSPISARRAVGGPSDDELQTERIHYSFVLDGRRPSVWTG